MIEEQSGILSEEQDDALRDILAKICVPMIEAFLEDFGLTEIAKERMRERAEKELAESGK